MSLWQYNCIEVILSYVLLYQQIFFIITCISRPYLRLQIIAQAVDAVQPFQLGRFAERILKPTTTCACFVLTNATGKMSTWPIVVFAKVRHPFKVALLKEELSMKHYFYFLIDIFHFLPCKLKLLHITKNMAPTQNWCETQWPKFRLLFFLGGGGSRAQTYDFPTT